MDIRIVKDRIHFINGALRSTVIHVLYAYKSAYESMHYSQLLIIEMGGVKFVDYKYATTNCKIGYSILSTIKTKTNVEYLGVMWERIL